jgi:hypothetical protein
LTPFVGYEALKRYANVRRAKIDVAGSFAFDCCGYALMSNHYHLVLFVDRDAAKAWTLDEVIVRWQKLFKASALVRRIPFAWLPEKPRERPRYLDC